MKKYLLKKYLPKLIRPVRMKIPLVLIRSKYQRKLPLARELFLVASREIVQIYSNLSNLSNLFPICMICTDLYDFCPLGHSFFSHHIATYREHHFQSYLEIMLLVRVNVFNSTHPTKRNFSIIICFMLFAEWLPILNRYKHKFMNNYMEIICWLC